MLHGQSQVSIMILGRLKMCSVDSVLGQISDYCGSLAVMTQLQHPLLIIGNLRVAFTWLFSEGAAGRKGD